MITLTLSVPNAAAIIAAGYPAIQMQKSSTQTAAGPYTAQTPLISLVAGQSSYVFVDVNGVWADYYRTVYYDPNTATASAASAPQAGWLSDVCSTVRDLLGVTTNEITDAQIQGISFLPVALAIVRQRLASTALGFDGIVAAGSDNSSAAIGALAHYTAALLCPRMTVAVVDSEVFDKYRYQRNRQMDWSATQALLLAQYELLISQADSDSQDNANVYESPIRLAGPTRAGIDTSGGLVPANGDDLDDEENPLIPFSGNWNVNG